MPQTYQTQTYNCYMLSIKHMSNAANIITEKNNKNNFSSVLRANISLNLSYLEVGLIRSVF